MPASAVEKSAPVKEVLPQLSLSQVVTTLYFTTILAEEVGKTSADSNRTYEEVSLVPEYGAIAY